MVLTCLTNRCLVPRSTARRSGCSWFMQTFLFSFTELYLLLFLACPRSAFLWHGVCHILQNKQNEHNHSKDVGRNRRSVLPRSQCPWSFRHYQRLLF